LILGQKAVNSVAVRILKKPSSYIKVCERDAIKL
jgi:hypothetical protein